MQEQSQNLEMRNVESNNFNAESDEADATLVSPRFDADDARQAHPVVPLDAVRTRPFGAKARTTVHSLRRSWPFTTLVVALLAAVAIGGGVAIHRAHRTPDAPASPYASSPAPSDAAPAQKSGAPTKSDADAPAPTGQHEDAQAEHAPRPTRGARDERDEREERILVPVEVTRGVGEDSKGEGEGRRDRGEGRDKRRKHEGDEEDSRKALKHAGKNKARLVDVITGPPR
jgi:hypothetical protein